MDWRKASRLFSISLNEALETVPRFFTASAETLVGVKMLLLQLPLLNRRSNTKAQRPKHPDCIPVVDC